MSEIVYDPEGRSEIAYSEMLIRQHPWMKDILHEGEIPLALSFRNADLFHGISISFLGCFAVLSPLLYRSAYPLWLALLIFLTGLGLIWLGVWLIFFRKKSYVVITKERVLYRKINLFGKEGKLVEIDRTAIRRVRFLKSTVMYRIGRQDGAIALTLENGKTVVISDVRNAESTFASIR